MTAIEGNAGVIANPRAAVSQVEQDVLQRAFARLDLLALGAGFAAVSGGALFVATIALLMQGGSLVGFHLKRLGNFLPGYDVSWLGAFVGLFEAAALGFVVGAMLAGMWNAYHRIFIALVYARERSREMRRELQEL